MSTHKQRTFTPDPTDPNSPNFDELFNICIAAREAMTEPCSRITETYFIVDPLDGDYDVTITPRACWMGHILKAYYYGQEYIPYSTMRSAKHADFIDQVSRRLGFDDVNELFEFNDFCGHTGIIAEFDRRLQDWNFN